VVFKIGGNFHEVLTRVSWSFLNLTPTKADVHCKVNS